MRQEWAHHNWRCLIWQITCRRCASAAQMVLRWIRPLSCQEMVVPIRFCFVSNSDNDNNARTMPGTSYLRSSVSRKQIMQKGALRVHAFPKIVVVDGYEGRIFYRAQKLWDVVVR